MAEKDLRYLLTVIKNSEFAPRWSDVAQEFGVNTASNAYDEFVICYFWISKELIARLTHPWTHRQRRFKSIVEKAGFKLENGKQVTGGSPLTQGATAATGTEATGDGGDGNGNSSVKSPKTPRKKADPGSPAKRRKSNTGKAQKLKVEKEDEGDDHDSKPDGGNGEVANAESG